MAKDVDQGWAWVALGAVFLTMLLIGGLVHTTGITYVLLLQAFPTDPLLTAMAGSLLISLTCVAGVIGGVLAGMTSCRTSMLTGSVILFSGLAGSAFATSIMGVVLTFGVVAGVGSGMVYTPAIASIGFYFEKRRDFASGVALGGIGAGLAVFPPLITIFGDLYGWRGVLLMLSGILLHALPLSALIRPSKLEGGSIQRSLSLVISVDPHPIEQHPGDMEYGAPPVNKLDQVKEDHSCSRERAFNCKIALSELFLNKPFLLFNFSTFLYGAGYAGISLYFPNYLKSLGEGRHRVALLISLGGISNMAARILTGMVTQNRMDATYVVYLGTIGLAGVFTLISPILCQTKVGQVVFACALGFYSQGNVSLLNSLTVDLLRLKLLPVGFGIIMLTMGAGFLLGPLMAGALIETFQSYAAGLVATGSVLLLSSVVGMAMAAVRPIRSGVTKEHSTKEHSTSSVLIHPNPVVNTAGVDANDRNAT